MVRREGARAPVHGGSGRDLPAPPARTWRRLRPSTWALVVGYAAAGALLAAGATGGGVALLAAAAWAGLGIRWIEDLRELARWRAEARESAERQCRVCGCTDEAACADLCPLGDLQTCWWVAEALCSACAPVHRSAWGVDW